MAEASPRFLSLDVFRGMTICFMIIVNTPGSNGAFWPLNHAAWNGFTPTDLVFPSFLFAVGNAMSFTMKKYQQMGNGAVLSKIFRRTLLIFLLGYLLYWFPFVDIHNGHWDWRPISGTRILGVLQRIALCYCFASLMVQYLPRNVVFLLLAVFLLGYWIILLVFGDPAHPFGMLTNAGTYLDKDLFGDSHLYHGEGVAFDPEGLLSTIPAIVNVIIGYYAGKFIQEKGKTYETISKLMLVGCLFIFISICWDSVFPINKKLWTSSFVFITTGLDLTIISFLIYLIEVRTQSAPEKKTFITDKYQFPIAAIIGLAGWSLVRLIEKFNWTRFFDVFGKNPLFIYLVSETILTILAWITLGSKNIPEWVDTFWQYVAHGKVGSLLFAITVMLACWLVGYILDKRKIYIRV